MTSLSVMHFVLIAGLWTASLGTSYGCSVWLISPYPRSREVGILSISIRKRWRQNSNLTAEPIGKYLGLAWIPVVIEHSEKSMARPAIGLPQYRSLNVNFALRYDSGAYRSVNPSPILQISIALWHLFFFFPLVTLRNDQVFVTGFLSPVLFHPLHSIWIASPQAQRHAFTIISAGWNGIVERMC